jgi:peroxiredoxin
MSDQTLPSIDFGTVGPAIGDPFPNLRLPDQHGQIVDLHEARADRQALVVFHRSASW